MKLKAIIILVILFALLIGVIYYFSRVPKVLEDTDDNNVELVSNEVESEGGCAKGLFISGSNFDKAFIDLVFDSGEGVVISSEIEGSLIPLDEDYFILFMNEEKDKLVIDSYYFSDLLMVDVTRLDKVVVMGNYRDLEFEDYTPWEIVQLLLRMHLIQTYWHLNANLCVALEEDTDEKYKVEFDAVHEYCTNECVSEDYKFFVEIDKVSGEISVGPK